MSTIESAAIGQQPPGDSGVCTLFEGDYHLGLAAFLNSLVRAGYKGTVWAGYRGCLPPWIKQLERIQGDNADEYRVSLDLRVVFLRVATSTHLTNYKPDFMLRLFNNEAKSCSYLWYFDPDIFLLMRWSYFSTWQRFGVALCQEVVDNILPSDAPLRRQWTALAESIGYANPRVVNHYYNGGMLGVPFEHKEFLSDWKRLIELAESSGYDSKVLGHGSREMTFNMGDQDALNVAVMYAKCPLTTLGPQGMGFAFGASMAMYHAVGPKPWRGSFLLRALMGLPPSGAAKCFLANARRPIRAYGTVKLLAKHFECSAASLIGRFYRRS
jgi:hypothetical protein